MADTLQSLRQHAGATPEAIAFRDDTGAVTYRALLRRVGAMAIRVIRLPEVVGILGRNDIDSVVADLGCKWAGKTVVHLPGFFSQAQRGHIVQDSGVGAVVAMPELAPQATSLGVPALTVDASEATPPPIPTAWRVIAYSSGTTGQPKGVVLGNRQIDRVATSLAKAAAATSDDAYLSVMPLALLLEQVGGIHVPLVVGAPSTLSAGLPGFALRGDGTQLAEAIAARRPTVLSLVPHVLAGWVAALERQGTSAPGSLRFVAVGGAPLPVALANAAWDRGIPVYEGYGLTECGSVVAVNRPGTRREGTVGRPIEGVTLSIENGEIVVGGDSVMQGYLHDAPAGAVWRTGDAGEIDADGNVIVRGRRDSVLVTSLGRNVHPEWVEAMIQADRRVAHCALVGDGGPWPVAIVEPSPAGTEFFSGPTSATPESLVWGLTGGAPDYARPRRVILAGTGTFSGAGLLTANGRPRRPAIAAWFRSAIAAANIPSSAPLLAS